MNFSSFLSLVQTIIVLIIVIALANISLKFLSKYMSKQNNIIKIVEKVGVNNNSALSVVEICGIYYLMSFTNNENKILKELDKDEVINIMESVSKDKVNWRDYFEMGKKVE
jgi:flagellar protein FliO/FliZ